MDKLECIIQKQNQQIGSLSGKQIERYAPLVKGCGHPVDAELALSEPTGE